MDSAVGTTKADQLKRAVAHLPLSTDGDQVREVFEELEEEQAESQTTCVPAGSPGGTKLRAVTFARLFVNLK